ncbi:AzlC family ABC transporter permease [Breznakiella homolactica]|uniref:AzlC family ABC transporter permease n=2 Tax=Breznakiella homolactica TaxID=2798577 RepID=A0A7T8BCE4_9SPIR|nr:AzlC family ABC transporter permease [Breznakiella homolactica]
MKNTHHRRIFTDALKYSVPVFLGYIAIGIAFGLLLADAGYPWWLALIMSIVMYAGAGQYMAVGLFASGVSLWEAALVQLVLNARHMAYGLTMHGRFSAAGPYKWYLIFSLTDETFALLSSLPPENGDPRDRSRFMFYVALLDQFYWILGSVIGAVAGTLIPFSLDGIGFALTALFIVLMIEQILQVRQPKPFIIAAAAAVGTSLLFPSRISLLSALVISLVLVQLFGGSRKNEPGGSPC